MKTIAKQLIDEHGLESFLCFSSVWNYYNSGTYLELLKNKNSNLHKDLKSLIHNCKKGITFFCGKKSRQQHGKTEILIFKGNKENGSFFSFKDLVNIFEC